MKLVLIIAAAVVGGVTVLAAGGLLVARLRTPSAEQMNLGIADDRLQPCPESPNCVSTCAAVTDQVHRVEPVPLTAPQGEALTSARAALLSLPRTAIVEQRDHYLRAESRSAVYRFIDDVEVLVLPGADAGSVVHFRSASRVGQGDMGANRSRYQAFRAALIGAEE
jgi:uncharacterized protein (DUF1499 family)